MSYVNMMGKSPIYLLFHVINATEYDAGLIDVDSRTNY